MSNINDAWWGPVQGMPARVTLTGTPMLVGANALIVEDEYLIALEMQRVLEAAGAAAIIVARNVAEGTEHTVSRAFDIALVAVGPGDSMAVSFMRALRQAGVAVVAVSSMGEHRNGIPGLDGIGAVIKPFADEDLLAAATAALLATMRAPEPP
jgi:DNA-binding response OmpR family regulator